MNLKRKVEHFVEELLDMMFPVRLGLRSKPSDKQGYLCEVLLDLLDNNIEQSEIKNQNIASSFMEFVPQLEALLLKDIEAIYHGDPSAKSHNEIILAFPGFFAVAAYRIAHYLHNNKVRLLPRMITEYAHTHTGVDIHPGAVIGLSFCIDHGTGIVIGETAIIGDRVKIYQGVTIGALSVKDRNTQGKRHPTIEDDVTIYAQAIILGGETIVGRQSIIGGNVWITKSVPSGTKVYYKNEV